MIMPINARKKIRIGISKIKPMPRMMLRNSEVYSPDSDHGLELTAEMNQKIRAPAG